MEEETQVEDTQVEEVNTEVENDDSLNVEEQEESSESNDDIPTVDDYNRLKAENEELEKKNKKLFERAKKVQAQESKGQPLKNNNDLTREEVILIAKGVSEDEINFLKTLQAGNRVMGKNVSLTELQTDPAFIALSERKKAEDKSARAGLGGSSRGVQKSEPTYQENMSRDDHKKLWAKTTGNG